MPMCRLLTADWASHCLGQRVRVRRAAGRLERERPEYLGDPEHTRFFRARRSPEEQRAV